MTDLVIGVDPDSDKHGVAVYVGGQLSRLDAMSSIELIHYCADLGQPLLSIEDVCSQNFIYARNTQGSKAAQSKVARNLGMVQQAQRELLRWLDYYSIRYELHKPSRANWAKSKALFERATGWTGRSNEDTRSAAYFGHLALRRAAA